MNLEQSAPALEFFQAIGLKKSSLENFTNNYDLCKSRILFASSTDKIKDAVSFIFHISPDKKTLGDKDEQVFLSSIVTKENGSVIFLGPSPISWHEDQDELFQNIKKKIAGLLACYDPNRVDSKSHPNSLPMFFTNDFRLELQKELFSYIEQFGLNRLLALKDLKIIIKKERDETYSGFISSVNSYPPVLRFSGENVPCEYIWAKDTDFPWKIISFDSKKLSTHIFDAYEQQYFDCLKKISDPLYEQFIETTKQPIYRELIDMGITNINQCYNWIIEPQSEHNQLKRWQAFKACPMFVSFAINQSCEIRASKINGEEFNIDLKGLETVIDQSQELITFIEAETKFTPAMIRWINQSKTEINVTRTRVKSAYSFLVCIGKFLPSNSYPSDPKQTAYFYTYLSTISRLTRWYSLKSSRAFQNILEQKENWLWKSQKISRSQIDCARDFIISFTKQCLYPQIIDRMEAFHQAYDQDVISKVAYKTVNDYSLVEKLLITKYSIRQIVEMSEYWHKNYQKINSKALFIEDHSWEPLFETLEIEGVRAECLCSAEMLEEEGISMNHCVSSYIDQCTWGQTHIVSLKTLEGERISTVEIIAHSDQNEITYWLNQNQGYKNSKPVVLAINAAERLIQAINSGEIQVDHDKLRIALEKRKIDYNQNMLLRLIGYNYKNLESRIAAFDAWRFTRKSGEKKMDYQQWIKVNDISELINSAINNDDSDYSTQTPYVTNDV